MYGRSWVRFPSGTQIFSLSHAHDKLDIPYLLKKILSDSYTEVNPIRECSLFPSAMLLNILPKNKKKRKQRITFKNRARLKTSFLFPNLGGVACNSESTQCK